MVGDNCWKKVSSTLEAGSKVYGYKVDKIHKDTYRILGGINRTDLNEDEEED